MRSQPFLPHDHVPVERTSAERAAWATRAATGDTCTFRLVVTCAMTTSSLPKAFAHLVSRNSLVGLHVGRSVYGRRVVDGYRLHELHDMDVLSGGHGVLSGTVIVRARSAFPVHEAKPSGTRA
mmetsp:Transcript_14924/g.36335  ORF Transcript_14924/g.36335 Transcript_14924/m.36335 type:complete len:123 (-) Transcript_14924:363-731(-)